MRRYAHHKYTWSKPFASVRHMWELVGPDGGLHFHVSLTPNYEPSCGLEFHHRNKTGDEAPSQTNCWLVGGPCWHDGTSLYASETLWPRIEPMLRSGDHETIFRILEEEADDRFGYDKKEDETA